MTWTILSKMLMTDDVDEKVNRFLKLIRSLPKADKGLASLQVQVYETEPTRGRDRGEKVTFLMVLDGDSQALREKMQKRILDFMKEEGCVDLSDELPTEIPKR